MWRSPFWGGREKNTQILSFVRAGDASVLVPEWGVRRLRPLWAAARPLCVAHSADGGHEPVGCRHKSRRADRVGAISVSRRQSPNPVHASHRFIYGWLTNPGQLSASRAHTGTIGSKRM